MAFPPITLQRQAEALAKAQRHWHEASPSVGNQPLRTGGWTVAIAREAGAPGTALAQELSQRLGWPVYDHQLIEQIAQEMGLRAQLLDSVDEKRKGWLRECIESCVAVTPVNEEGFVRHLIETLLSLGAHGRCIIVGRGSAFVLPAESTLRVRLMAPKQDRIAAIERRMQMTPAQAARWVDETDRERVRFSKDHFFKNVADPTLYDLILNSSRWSVSQCAELTVKALMELESQSERG